MIIKPEAIITNKISEIFSILKSNNYELCYWARKNISSIQVADLWKFSWTNSSIENIIINQKVFSVCEAVILILHLPNIEEGSACEKLTELKGPAIKSKRKPYQIRCKVEPINYMLNFIHTSDDSNDFLRELGILFETDELIQIFNDMSLERVVDYPAIVEDNSEKRNYSLMVWGDKILNKLKNCNCNSADKKNILSSITLLKENNAALVNINFIYLLCKYDLIKWDFETIVIISSRIGNPL